MFDTGVLRQKFESGMTFDEFVAAAEPEGHHLAWLDRHKQLELTDAQRTLVESFTREMRVLCLTGPWCGDCALQGAAMARIAEANPDHIRLRFLNRNDHAEMQIRVPINGGMRVPVTFFLAEDHEPVSRFGDRTLSRYRSMARKALGEHAPVIAPAPTDPVRSVLQEMLDEFERVQLLLRLSTRLRERQGD
jgi:thiol-disulfide isomerase/thioredoxin